MTKFQYGYEISFKFKNITNFIEKEGNYFIELKNTHSKIGIFYANTRNFITCISFENINNIKDISQNHLTLLTHFIETNNLIKKIHIRPFPPPPLSNNKFIKYDSIMKNNTLDELRQMNEDLLKKTVEFQAELEKDNPKTKVIMFQLLNELQFNN